MQSFWAISAALTDAGSFRWRQEVQVRPGSVKAFVDVPPPPSAIPLIEDGFDMAGMNMRLDNELQRIEAQLAHPETSPDTRRALEATKRSIRAAYDPDDNCLDRLDGGRVDHSTLH